MFYFIFKSVREFMNDSARIHTHSDIPAAYLSYLRLIDTFISSFQ